MIETKTSVDCRRPASVPRFHGDVHPRFMAQPPPRRRSVRLTSLAGLALGLLMVVGGAARRLAARPEEFRSAAPAAQYQSARHQLHELTYDEIASGKSTPPNERQSRVAAARQEFARLEQDLQRARTHYQRSGTQIIEWGLAVVVLSGIGYLASRPD
ncbi:MAG: hypothetical protein IT424_02555 [Pirellulales bacterium]|nr:hypothetical protein [Pirellulales bacterium]